jgi:hypothetical protein
MSRHAIAVITYNRPDYTAQMLRALAACRGIEQWHVHFQCEPGCDAVLKLVGPWNYGASKSLTVNSQRLGCNVNILTAIDTCFRRGHYFTAVQEDDVLYAPDALEFLLWGQSYAFNPTVLLLQLWRRSQERLAGLDYAVTRGDLPHIWGWGTWADRWPELRDGWNRDGSRSWDCHLADTVWRNQARAFVSPLLPRSQNIGALNGVNYNSQETYIHYAYNAVWAGNVALEAGVFQEL